MATSSSSSAKPRREQPQSTRRSSTSPVRTSSRRSERCPAVSVNRVQLAKMLTRGGNVILLDEPTNDLDLDTLRVLEEGIQNFPGCMVIVSHDRYFLDRVCTKILDLGNYEPGKFLDSL